MRRVAIWAIVLGITVSQAHVASGRKRDGDAAIIQIGHGERERSAIESTSHAFDDPAADRTTGNSAESQESFASRTPHSSIGLVANRCIGLVSNDEYTVFSNSPTCSSFAGPDPAAPAAPAAPAQTPSPEQIAFSAMDRAIALAPNPELRLAPARVGLTGLDSFFWLREEPRPITATASAGGFGVTAEAYPTQYVWDFGDDSRKTTSHAGRPWTRHRDGDIAHMYETRARYDVTVEVIWEARWRLGAGEWRPLGYFTTSDTVEYPVREVVAFLVRPR